MKNVVNEFSEVNINKNFDLCLGLVLEGMVSNSNDRPGKMSKKS